MTFDLDRILADAGRGSGSAIRNGVTPSANGHVKVERTLVLRQLSTVQPEAIEWIWHGRVPHGKLTLIVGDPGSCKSFLALQIAAHITTGRCFPDEPSESDREPASVILWNGEDGAEDTIRPRAEQCGVDLPRLRLVDSATDVEGRASPFRLSDVRLLEADIKRIGDVKLVMIDPITALLANVDAHRDAEVRSALQPLQDLARLHNVAVVCIAHLNKGEAQRAMYRVGGSIGFTGAARSVLLVARDQDSGRRAIVPIKQNLSAPVDPIEFRVDDQGFWWGRAASELSADRLLAAGMPHEERSALREAQGSIIDALSQGELWAEDLERAVVDNRDVKKKTFERARTELRESGQIERYGGGRHGQVGWRLVASLGQDEREDEKSSLAHDSLLSLNNLDEREDEPMSETT